VTRYKAVLEAPADWLPAIVACYRYPADEFAGRWILQGLSPRPRTLKPLITVGVLRRSQEASADGKTWYAFVDKEGAGRALRERDAVQ
jgi:hypothetical protein